ncbi:hypothetical protein L0668_14750 [Paraglaciecola aquimarina]|uniref:Tetratricopeptide repeat protein n=1 Tax=Paraglaciecola algarum TaxID=3050085 RepID=A0ABS9DCL2_9ALTE|nr:hypothetical protein [Paraglaciecola sp. G1-23]MCF2949376.1 hypothetical protein [Paraglaciecola sp. G1-23]
MIEYQYICIKHRIWVDENPELAFDNVLQLSKQAEKKLLKNQYDEAIILLGTAFETAEIIFDNRLESPQLTTCLTSSAIMLAHAYSMTGQVEAANRLLVKLKHKMQCAINCAVGYATKVAFFKHCSEAITEANNDITNAIQDNPNHQLSYH